MSRKRRQITVTVTLSLKPGVTAAEARRELRTRVNELSCYSLDEEDVRVRKIAAPPSATLPRELLRDCMAAVDSLCEQVDQMKGMFSDDDDTIQNALDDGENASARASAYLAGKRLPPINTTESDDD